jgi:hypothetical protein
MSLMCTSYIQNTRTLDLTISSDSYTYKLFSIPDNKNYISNLSVHDAILIYPSLCTTKRQNIFINDIMRNRYAVNIYLYYVFLVFVPTRKTPRVICLLYIFFLQITFVIYRLVIPLSNFTSQYTAKQQHEIV